jgi:hypothetical protein
VAISYPDPVLSDEVLRLRPWSLDDLDCVREAGTDPAIPSHTTVSSRWTVDAGRAFIDRQGKRVESGEGISLAMHDLELDRAVGLVSLMLRPQPSVIGLGYWVVPSARQRGLARRAAMLTSGWAIGSGGVLANRGVGRAGQPPFTIRSSRCRIRARRSAEIIPRHRRFEIRRTRVRTHRSDGRLTHTPDLWRQRGQRRLIWR